MYVSEISPGPCHSQWCANGNENSHFCSLPSQYPVIPPIFEIEGHGSLSSAKADKLYSLLMKEAGSRLNTLMIYDLIAIAQEFVQGTMKEVRERRKKEELSRKDEEVCL